MVQWSDFRDQFQRSILNDAVKTTWSDEEALDFLEWGLASLADFEAMATSTSFAVPATATFEYTLPGNIFSDLATTGTVRYEYDDDTYQYLDPVRYTHMVPRRTLEAYWEHPRGTLNVGSAPLNIVAGNTTLVVDYFAYYNVPSQDTDTIDVPVWARHMLMLHMGIHAMTNEGNKQSKIRQWAEKKEGDSEENALRIQQGWLLRLLKEEEARHTRQDRVSYFRNTWGI